MPQILVQEPASGLQAGGGRAAFGYSAGDPVAAKDRQIMELPLPGMTAPLDHYSSVLMLGLLGCDEELNRGYASTAFASGAASGAAVFRIVY